LIRCDGVDVEVGRATDTVDVDDVIDEEDTVDFVGASMGEPPGVSSQF
jgi:hypothetical protein